MIFHLNYEEWLCCIAFVQHWTMQRYERIALKQWKLYRETTCCKYGPIAYWDTSNVSDMSQLFKNWHAFNDNINTWDVSNVTNMHGMF